MLQTRADCKGVSLETVKIDPVLSDLDIMPDADLQRQNASLAIALASLVLQKIGSNSLMKSTPSSTRPGKYCLVQSMRDFASWQRNMAS